MGIYDRDYYREERPGMTLRGPRTIVGTLILVNVALYLADGLLTPGNPGQLGAITGHLAVNVGTLTQPWMWWKFLTYGFAHDPSPQHILFNMFALFIFGRDIEMRYGRNEFLRLYLLLLVVGSVVWTSLSKLSGVPSQANLIGASGAVVGIVVLYALNFPRRTLLLFFILPIPAWLLGVLLVAMDLFGAVARPDSGVAYTVHLAGAATAFLYFHFGWHLGRLMPAKFRFQWPKAKPKLRVHDPDRPRPRESDLGEEVDRILAKIHREGEAALTRKERRTLQAASQQYQEKRQQSADRDI